MLEYLSRYAIRGNNEIWHLLNYSWLKSTTRRDRGQYFTPPLLRRFMVDIYPPAPSDRVCDPCGGSGGFLITAADRLPSILPDHLFYFDIDHAACRNARASFVMYAHPATGASLADIHAETCDSLDGPWPTLDLILTNVPFGVRVGKDARQSADSNRSILSAYATGRGRASQLSQVLFIERCLKQLAPGGRLAAIVDKGVVTNEKLRRERQILARLSALELVVELPGVAFEYFAGTTFPTYLLFFTKKEIDRTCFAMLIPGTLGYDDRGYHGGGGTPTFGPDGEEDGWGHSAFPAIVKKFRTGTLPGAPFAEVRESGDWHHGPHKYKVAGTTVLGDIATLSSTP